MKTSKIKSIQGNGSWTHKQYGLLYSHEYTFEDGVTLVANSKTENPIHKVGDEVEYQITKTTDQGNSGKVSKPQEQTFQSPGKIDKVQIYIIKQSSLNRAIEHLSVIEPEQNLNKENVIALAQFYTDWVLKS